MGKDAFGSAAKHMTMAAVPTQTARMPDAPVSRPAEPQKQRTNEDDSVRKYKQYAKTDVSASGKKMTLVEYLEYCGMEVIDKRCYGGCLWVVGTESSIGSVIEEAKELFKIGGTYCGGGRATSFRPGWFSKARTTEARIIPGSVVEIDYNEVTTAAELYNKYFGRIDGLLILEDEAWTNEYCFVVDRMSSDGKKLEGVCYCKGKFQKYNSYFTTRKFKVFSGVTADTISRIHLKYKKNPQLSGPEGSVKQGRSLSLFVCKFTECYYTGKQA